MNEFLKQLLGILQNPEVMQSMEQASQTKPATPFQKPMDSSFVGGAEAPGVSGFGGFAGGLGGQKPNPYTANFGGKGVNPNPMGKSMSKGGPLAGQKVF